MKSPARRIAWRFSVTMVVTLAAAYSPGAPTASGPDEKPTTRAADAPAGSATRPAATSQPAPQAQAAAERMVREVYKADYAKRDPAERAAFARRLTRQSESESEMPLKYVLLREARDVAAAAGDYPAAAEAIDHMAAEFATDVGAQRAAALATAARSAVTPKAAGEVAEGAMAAIEQAVSDGDYDGALKRLAPLALAAAQRAANAGLLARVNDRVRDLRAMQADFLAYKDAAKTLATKPDDPKANLAVGRFLTFAKGDAAHGLPALAKSGDPVLAPLAKQELAAPDDPDEQVKLGDAWLAVAEKQPAGLKAAAQGYAGRWYALALPKLTGLQKRAVQSRMKALPLSVSFEQLAARIAAGVDKSGQSGKRGASGGAERPASPGLLVGVDYTVGGFEGHSILKSLRPIFLTADGKVKGRTHGKSTKEWQTIEAKPGYAVGGVVTDGTNRCNGMKLLFMPVHGAVLDPDAAYESPWIGGHAATDLDTFGGDGRPVVGVQITSGADVDAFGLVQAR